MTRAGDDRSTKLGAELRRLRRARNLTQADLADRAGYSRAYVALVETGRERPSVEFLRRLEQALDAPGALLPLHSQPCIPSREIAINRRAVLVSGLAAAAGMAAGQPRSPVDPAVVPQLLELRMTLVKSDALLGPRYLISAATEQTARAVDLLQRAPTSLRRQVLEVAALYAEFSSWLYDDAGDATSGSAWSDRALAYAQTAANPDLVSYVLMRKGQQSAAAGQGALTAAYAAAACREEDRLAPAVRAAALQQQAHGSALDGDERSCLRDLDLAEALVSSSPAHVAPFSLASYCTPAYVEAQRGACWLRLGRPARAVASLDRALSAWPADHRRERGIHLARKARALAAAGQADEAAAVAGEASVLARETGSARTLGELGHSPDGSGPKD